MAPFVENASELHHALADHDHAGIMAHLADDAVLHQGKSQSSTECILTVSHAV
jgi:hypothetical protein